MIPFPQRITAIVFSLSLVWIIVQLIRKHKLREEYAFSWLAIGLVILVFSLFGGLVNGLAELFHVSYPPTLILVLGLLFALVVLLWQSVVLSGQANQLRDLTQHVAILEWRLQQLEQGEGSNNE